jgi:hypothetical protein
MASDFTDPAIRALGYVFYDFARMTRLTQEIAQTSGALGRLHRELDAARREKRSRRALVEQAARAPLSDRPAPADSALAEPPEETRADFLRVFTVWVEDALRAEAKARRTQGWVRPERPFLADVAAQARKSPSRLSEYVNRFMPFREALRLVLPEARLRVEAEPREANTRDAG